MGTVLWVLVGQTVAGLALFYFLRYLNKKRWEKIDARIAAAASRDVSCLRLIPIDRKLSI